MSCISTARRFLETTNLPSKKVCGSCSAVRRFADNKSAKSTNWPLVIFATSLAGIGACPGPTTNALSTDGGKSKLPRLEDELATWVAVNGEAKDSTGRAELEPVVADTDGKVDTNAGNVHVPEAAAIEPATTVAGVEQTVDVTPEGTLDTGAALSRIAAMMVGRELLNAWAIADAMSLENDEDVPAEAAETTTLAAEEEGEEVHVDGITPADKLL